MVEKPGFSAKKKKNGFSLDKLGFSIEKLGLFPSNRIFRQKAGFLDWKTGFPDEKMGFLVEKPRFSNLVDKPVFSIGEKPGISIEKLDFYMAGLMSNKSKNPVFRSKYQKPCFLDQKTWFFAEKPSFSKKWVFLTEKLSFSTLWLKNRE